MSAKLRTLTLPGASTRDPSGFIQPAWEIAMMREAATAGDLCTRQVAVAPPSLSVDEAARMMRERASGEIRSLTAARSVRSPRSTAISHRGPTPR